MGASSSQAQLSESQRRFHPATTPAKAPSHALNLADPRSPPCASGDVVRTPFVASTANTMTMSAVLDPRSPGANRTPYTLWPANQQRFVMQDFRDPRSPIALSWHGYQRTPLRVSQVQSEDIHDAIVSDLCCCFGCDSRSSRMFACCCRSHRRRLANFSGFWIGTYLRSCRV
jgi:hypothetical protein